MVGIGGAIGTRLASILVASPVLKGAVRQTAFESGVDSSVARFARTRTSKLLVPQHIAFQYLPQRIPEHSSEISQALRKVAT